MVILYLDLPKKYRLKPLSKQSDDIKIAKDDNPQDISD